VHHDDVHLDGVGPPPALTVAAKEVDLSAILGRDHRRCTHARHHASQTIDPLRFFGRLARVRTTLFRSVRAEIEHEKEALRLNPVKKSRCLVSEQPTAQSECRASWLRRVKHRSRHGADNESIRTHRSLDSRPSTWSSSRLRGVQSLLHSSPSGGTSSSFSIANTSCMSPPPRHKGAGGRKGVA